MLFLVIPSRRGTNLFLPFIFSCSITYKLTLISTIYHKNTILHADSTLVYFQKVLKTVSFNETQYSPI